MEVQVISLVETIRVDYWVIIAEEQKERRNRNRAEVGGITDL